MLCLLSILTIGLPSPPSQAGVRELTFTGTMMNQTNWQGDFPFGEDFTLTVDIEDTTPDSQPSPASAVYLGSMGDVSFSIANGGFSITGAGTVDRWELREDAGYTEPALKAEFNITPDGGGDPVGVVLNGYRKIGSGPIPQGLDQPFDLTDYRLFTVKIQLDGINGLNDMAAGFGWISPQTPVSAAGSAPAPIRTSGYTGILPLGDSLSASTNPNTPSSPENYFDGGYANGPVWVQYLGWMLGIEDRKPLNGSSLDGYEAPPQEILDGVDFTNYLATSWINTPTLSFVFALVFSGGDPAAGATLAGSFSVESELVLLETTEFAHALGIRDFLMLGGADIGFAPALNSIISPGDQAGLESFVTAYNSTLQTYVAQWFPNLFPGVRVTYLDPNLYLDDIFIDPAKYGFTVMGSASAINTETDLSFDGPGATYFFWDDLAPGTKVHSQLAGRVYDDVFSPDHWLSGEFHQRLVKLGDDEIWLFANNPFADLSIDPDTETPPDQDFDLLRTTDLDFDNAIPVESLNTVDPALFFIIPRGSDEKGFFRVEAPGTTTAATGF